MASFHLVTLGAAGAALQLPRVPLDRRHLASVPGLRFGRLLGTGRGSTMAASADLTRWALLCVWDDDDARAEFRTGDPLSLRWDDACRERFDVDLDPLGAHGSWGGVDPLTGRAPGDGEPAGARPPGAPEGPVAVLTRATIRVRALRTFAAAVPPVEDRLHGVDGLLATVGVGEAPIARQATFSLWRDADAVRDFAYRSPEHAEVVRRTHDERWYGEEWFARFRPTRTWGTWGGRRPLAGLVEA